MRGHPDDCAPGVPSPGYRGATFTATVKPRGAEPVCERKVWPLSQIRVAAGQCIAEGKAIVTCDGGVITMAYHPISRIAPNVEGDGFALADELADTQDDNATTSELPTETRLVVRAKE